MRNNYSSNFIDSCVKSFLNKLYTLINKLYIRLWFRIYLKRNVFAKLPLLGSTSFQIRTKLERLFSDKIKSCNFKIVFTPPVRVKSFFTFKDKLTKM